MDIINRDFKKGVVNIRVTDPEDLWYLSHLIEAGDIVRGKTTRKVKIGDSENAKTVKKTYVLEVEAETVNYEEIALRVLGKVKLGPEEVPKDSYHSITLEEGSECSIMKPHWPAYQKQKLHEASEKRFKYLICIFDREEALFALTKNFGYEVLVRIKGDVPKKTKTVEIKKDFQQEILKALDVYNGRYTPESVILASPAFYKEDVYKKVKDKALQEKIILTTCSDVSESSLNEVLKQPELAQTLKTSRARQEQIIMEELLKEIQKDNLATYGLEDVKQANNAGAIRTLLVTDEFIMKQKEAGKFTIVDEIMKMVDELQGDISIISAEFESGKKLDGLGGIAAILRYKLQ